jgi:hypothetical protein
LKFQISHLRGVDEGVILEPLGGLFLVSADEENFLDGSGAEIEAFDSGRGFVLEFELKLGCSFSASDFDSAGDDAGDVGALGDDPIEDWIEAGDAAVLAFDAAKFHGGGL